MRLRVCVFSRVTGRIGGWRGGQLSEGALDELSSGQLVSVYYSLAKLGEYLGEQPDKEGIGRVVI